MWVILSFVSAFFIGIYDVFKKKAVVNNAVIPVLFYNSVISLIIYIPILLLSQGGVIEEGTLFHAPLHDLKGHLYIATKSTIVIASWIFGYFSMKHLPITIVGPINATRPVMVLFGAMLIYGERLNGYQWIGIILAIVAFWLLSLSGKREGINFKRNKWVLFAVLSAMFGAASGLFDKFLLGRYEPMFVQSWFNIYQFVIMCFVMLLVWYPIRNENKFEWRWSVAFVPIILSVADFIYFYALTQPDVMISVVSMIRRSSVIVSFILGAIIFKEKNLKSKAIVLSFMLLGMIFIFFGSRVGG